ncbi:MAG TPA: class I SAM-dependent methyltransferase [Gemmatimonadaceae bacterium]|nr:class I SAM-dependent methyltransferase [Gemmatimonadaceae bacterium]
MGAQFDEYAQNYDAALNRGLSISGESKDYFARERVRWIAARLRQVGAQPTRVLDYGCGTGSAGPELLRQLNVRSVTGVDASPEILATARGAHRDQRLEFSLLTDMEPSGCFDLAFCNGVFHHIVPAQRLDALAYIHRSLASGGYFGFWENNPWNPGTRLVMSRIPFDRDAELLWPSHARHLLQRAGFRVLRTDFVFLFPRVLAALRPLEAQLASIPAGAQYLVLSQKG